MSIKIKLCAIGSGSSPQVVLGITAQARQLGGWRRRSLEWTGQRLSVASDGQVHAAGPLVNVTLTRLPRDVAPITQKNNLENSSKVSAAADHLVASVLAVGGKGVALPNSSTVLALLELAYSDCQGSKTDACSYVLCVESDDAGVSWRVRSEVTSAGNEAAMLQLEDGRLLAVMRHDCELDNSTGMVSWVRFLVHVSLFWVFFGLVSA